MGPAKIAMRRNRDLPLALATIFLTLLLGGCQTPDQVFSGFLSVGNEGSETIWVDRTKGLQNEITAGRIGALPKHTYKYLPLGRMPLPNSLTIYWREADGGDVRSSVLNLADFQPTERWMPLVLSYKNGAWEATLVKERSPVWSLD